jgi:1-pyrroline-5-carboxylate dehydrogenase
MKAQAAQRNLENLTIGPILTWSNEKFKAHLDAILELPDTKILWGGVPLKNHQIPSIYGSYEPTAVYVPLRHFRGDRKRKLLCTELFGPF